MMPGERKARKEPAGEHAAPGNGHFTSRALCCLLAMALECFCAAGLASADAQGVRAWQASIQLPTYDEGDADPNPQFSVFAYEKSNYPYPLRTSVTKTWRKRAWRTLNLENEYLFCRVLPDLGGHLYSCRDKRSGREMFYANPVIKKALIGLRGAWTALGIESNFPAAHTRATTSPVDFALRTESGGSARAVVEETDRAGGMQWRVEYVLRPASTVLEQRVTLYNRGSARRGYLWWSNAGVEFDDPETRFVLPARLVAGHGTAVIESWPITSAGTDESRVRGHKSQAGWFAYGCREPFFAVYKPGSRSGVAHFADPQVVAGKKLYLWGAEDDNYVRRELTDNFPSYIEVQGGLFQNQETSQFLEPGGSRTFSEYWIPVHDIGGISRVTSDALVNLERRNGSPEGPVLSLELSATRLIKDAVIRLFRDGQPAFEARTDLDPARTFTHLLKAPGASAYTVQLADSRGSILLEHTENRYDTQGPEGIILGKQPSPPAPVSPETEAFPLERGRDHELHERPRSALYEYQTGLERFPDSIPLQKALGRLDVGLNRFEEAAKLLARVHAAVPGDDEASYYLGVAQTALGRDADARQSLSQVRPASGFGAPAALQLALVFARAGEYPASLEALKPLLSAPPGSARPGALEVALLRRSGRPQEAREKLAVWQTIDPADSMLRFESTLLGSDDPELWPHLGADSERVLNLVDEYLSLGLDEDALRLLDHPYPSLPPEEIEPGAVPPAASPLFFYYRAYCRARLGQNPSEDLKTAAGSSTRYAFPFRPSSIAVLKHALRANPSDAPARLLLGRLFLHGLMVDEAIAEWQAARSLNPRLPELHRDLGRALIGPKKDPIGGLIVLKEGLRSDPGNPDLRAELKRADPATVPEKPGSAVDRPHSSPVEAASDAMLRAASGSAEEAARLFDASVFPAERQPETVRRAYIEVQLRRLASEAGSGRCSAMADRLDRLGEEDRNLPFTFHGFRDFMKAAHFQYYWASIEHSCGDDKNSRKRWMKISKMSELLPSPEFVFPLLAGWKLDPESAKPRVAAGLESVRAALASAQGASRLPLMYAEAVLLHVQGEDERAALQLREVLKASEDVSLRYLAALQLGEIFK